MKREKIIGISWQVTAYLAALFVAAIIYSILPPMHIIVKFLLADIAATIAIFVFSFIFKNSSFYDPYWSLQPIVIAVFLAFFIENEAGISLREWLVITLVTVWGLRLTYNFIRGWQGLHEQDWRYNDLAEKHGKFYWIVSFAGIHMLPTILVFGGCLCLFAIYLGQANAFGIIDMIALLITGTAILLEAIADQQLYRFKKAGHEKGAILDKGVWAKVRHPNYLGEIGFWWGLFMFSIAANPGYWWSIIGALSITLLFVFISIPMIDTRMKKRRPSYAKHMKQTPALFPGF